VGEHAGMTDKPNPSPWVNMQEWHIHRVGEHPGIVGEHNQEWWVSMLRNLQDRENQGVVLKILDRFLN